MNSSLNGSCSLCRFLCKCYCRDTRGQYTQEGFRKQLFHSDDNLELMPEFYFDEYTY